MNTVIQTNGEILTAKVWRKQNAYFPSLPFYSHIPSMDDMAVALKVTLSDCSEHEPFCASLVVRYSVFFM